MSKIRPSADWNADQFGVVVGEKLVGNISRQWMSGTAERWWWEITTQQAQKKPKNARGPAESRDEAMAAFRQAWDQLEVE